MDVGRRTEFSIYLDDRPGALAGVLEAAAAAGVTVMAVSVPESPKRGLVRLIGDPVETLREVCEALVDSSVGPVVESTILAVTITERPNALRDIACRMADAGINVLYAYHAPSLNGHAPICLVRTNDLERAEDLIREIA